MILTMNNVSFNDNYLQRCTVLPWELEWHLLMPIFFSPNLRQTLYQPRTWWCYIDGIFMIWTHSVDDLQTFTTYLNTIHHTIKFTCNHSFTPMPFLDVNVSLNMVKSLLIFTLNLLTNINTCYILHVTPNTLNELFHSA